MKLFWIPEDGSLVLVGVPSKADIPLGKEQDNGHEVLHDIGYGKCFFKCYDFCPHQVCECKEAKSCPCRKEIKALLIGRR